MRSFWRKDVAERRWFIEIIVSYSIRLRYRYSSEAQALAAFLELGRQLADGQQFLVVDERARIRAEDVAALEIGWLDE